jgi:hypothetical protein
MINDQKKDDEDHMESIKGMQSKNYDSCIQPKRKETPKSRSKLKTHNSMDSEDSWIANLVRSCFVKLLIKGLITTVIPSTNYVKE